MHSRAASFAGAQSHKLGRTLLADSRIVARGRRSPLVTKVHLEQSSTAHRAVPCGTTGHTPTSYGHIRVSTNHMEFRLKLLAQTDCLWDRAHPSLFPPQSKKKRVNANFRDYVCVHLRCQDEMICIQDAEMRMPVPGALLLAHRGRVRFVPIDKRGSMFGCGAHSGTDRSILWEPRWP